MRNLGVMDKYFFNVVSYLVESGIEESMRLVVDDIMSGGKKAFSKVY